MRRNDTTRIGDLGEAEALRLLNARGYSGSNLNDLRRNAWTYDLEITTVRGPVRISVKTARAKRDVSLGRPRSLNRLDDDTFVMILLPTSKKQEIQIEPGGYHLLIVPGHVVKDEALAAHYYYWGDEVEKAEENTVRIKDEVNRPGSRSRAGHVFASWSERFLDAWHVLPDAVGRLPFFEGGKDRTVINKTVAPNREPASKPHREDRRITLTSRDIVRSLKYLESVGMSPEGVSRLHHFGRVQGFAFLIDYFSRREIASDRRGDTNRAFGERLSYVEREHRAAPGKGFASLIAEARRHWPLPG